MNFHETKMGQKFFCRQLPELIEALTKIAEAEAKQQQMSVLRLPEGWQQDDVLEELFSGAYQPESMKYKGDDSLHKNMIDAHEALLKTLSSRQWELFDAYGAAENRCCADSCLRAFRDGVQLAVGVILAGCAPTGTGEETVQ